MVEVGFFVLAHVRCARAIAKKVGGLLKDTFSKHNSDIFHMLLLLVCYPAMVGGALCHLLPDSMEDLGTISFPLAGALTGVGYIVTVLIEAIAVSIMDSIGAQHSHQLNDDHQDLEEMWIQGDNDSVYQNPHLDHSLCQENTEGQCLQSQHSSHLETSGCEGRVMGMVHQIY